MEVRRGEKGYVERIKVKMEGSDRRCQKTVMVVFTAVREAHLSSGASGDNVGCPTRT
jgi:hypothetical protein